MIYNEFQTSAPPPPTYGAIEKKANQKSANDKHYDVGIMGWWAGMNYGTVCTYFALCQMIKSLGFSPVMIHSPESKQLRELDTNLRKKHYATTEFLPEERLHELNASIDSFVIGSDQYWNYHTGFRQFRMLDFVSDKNKRISYATSFGHAQLFFPPEVLEKVIPLMKKFDAVSIREKSGVKISKDVFKIDAEWVLDPVLASSFNVFDVLADNANSKTSGDFLFAYILDPDDNKKRAIFELAVLLNLKIISITDRQHDTAKKIEEMKEFNIIKGASVEDFLYHFKHAKFIVTDSYHGFCFSLKYNKQFIGMLNKSRGTTRFDTLINLLGLTNILSDDLVLKDLNLWKLVDYQSVNEILDRGRQRSVKWLEHALGPSITGKLQVKKCTGCGACVSCCPKDALSLVPDELGFYRSVLDREKCINCGKCVKICPAKELPVKQNTGEPKCYAFIASNQELLFKSSSGGIFSLLAKETLQKGGVVFGAAWADDFSVEHIMIESEADLHKLQKSKYFQSYMGNICRTIEEKLEAGVPVLFSGCPCQAAGLKAYLNKDYENLVILDLLCGNAPSRMFFKKYMDEAFEKNSVRSFEFRHKLKGGHMNAHATIVSFNDGSSKIFGEGWPVENIYMREYIKHDMTPSHCEHCQYQTLPRFGDLTIGDFWGINKKELSVNVNNGCSVILANNEKGERLLRSIPMQEISFFKEVPLDWLGGNGYSRKGQKNWASPNRDKFYAAINTLSFSQSMDYTVNGLKGRCAVSVRYEGANYPVPFYFDPLDGWTEEQTEDGIRLGVKDGYSVPGNRAHVFLPKPLKKDSLYKYTICFRIATLSSELSFYLYNSLNKTKFQEFFKLSIPGQGSFRKFSGTFSLMGIPNSGEYDSLMFAARQISGYGNYIEIDYIGVESVSS